MQNCDFLRVTLLPTFILQAAMEVEVARLAMPSSPQARPKPSAAMSHHFSSVVVAAPVMVVPVVASYNLLPTPPPPSMGLCRPVGRTELARVAEGQAEVSSSSATF